MYASRRGGAAVLMGLGVVISAVLCAIGTSAITTGALCYISLVPWFWALRYLGAAAGAATGLAFGVLFGMIVTSWMPDSLGAIGADRPTALLLWIGTVGAQAGVPFALFGGVIASLRHTTPVVRVVAPGALLFVIELFRSYLPGAIPWALLGHSQWQSTGVAQLAAVGGVPLISALLGAANAVITEFLAAERPAARRLALRAAAGVAGGVTLLGLAAPWAAEGFRTAGERSNSELLRVLAVQPNIAVAERWASRAQRTNLKAVAELTERGLAKAPVDLIVWPETILTTPVESDPQLRQDLARWVARLDAPLVLGAVRPPVSGEPGRYRNSVLWVGPTGAIRDAFDKTRGVPIAESEDGVPGRKWVHSRLLSGPSDGLRLETGHDQRPLRGHDFELAVVFCYEALFPRLVSARRSSETLAILNLANDTWFHGEAVSHQQMAYAVFRAIEQRLWLLRVAHGGISTLVDPLGRIRTLLPAGVSDSFVAELPRESPATLFERATIAGLAVLGALLGFSASTLFVRRTP